MRLSDEALLQAWQRGDKAAGTELFDRYFHVVSRFFRNKVDRGIDDLIQATFLRLLEARDGFRGDGTFRGFVLGIAFNVLRNHYYTKRVDAERVDLGVVSVHDLAPRPSEALAARAEARLLLEGLRRIPVEHQVLLELYFWEPLGAPEIAAMLGVPVGTIRTRIRRAKQLLEIELGKLTTDAAVLNTTIDDLEGWARRVREGFDTDRRER